MTAGLSCLFLLFSVYLCLTSALTTNSICQYPKRHLMTSMAMSKETPLTVPKNYNVAIGSFATSALLLANQNIIASIPLFLLGILLFVQTGKVRFVFDDEALEIFVARKDETGNVINASRENAVVGGQNRWKYSTFTDWYFIPSKSFPILMYFKESQTKATGQVHLFPIIMDGKVLYDTLMKKVGSVSIKKN